MAASIAAVHCRAAASRPLRMRTQPRCAATLDGAAAWHALLSLRRQVLRDVGAVLCSPSLLVSSAQLRVAHALPPDHACADGGMRAKLAWLASLDAAGDEGACADTLHMLEAAKRSKRLGLYFQDCITFWLCCYPPYAGWRRATGVQVIVGGDQSAPAESQAPPPPTTTQQQQQLPVDAKDVRAKRLARKAARKGLLPCVEAPAQARSTHALSTIGEFDVLLRDARAVSTDTRTIHHLELSVKFLLLRQDDADGSSEFVGPHKAETLTDRVARMARQLALPAQPDAARVMRAACADVEEGDGHDVVVDTHSAAFLKGYLFYAHADYVLFPHDTIRGGGAGGDSAAGAAALVSAAHWRGWWCRDAEEVLSHPAHARARWMLLPKRDWLSPARAGADNPALLDADALRAAIRAADEAIRTAAGGNARQREAAQRARRLMVAEMQATSDECCEGDWAEVSRGFLVEADW